MDDHTTTPMMVQYLQIREKNPGSLLFYRMGDFYEMFFDDAVAASAALDIALTKRGFHHGQPIAMCGVPVHAAEGYLLTLIRKGFRVAIAEQLEDPAEAKKRGSKSVVRRDVVRLITPGTLTEESLLESRRNNFLAVFAEIRDESALAWTDISTGEIRVMDCPLVRLGPELARLSPREALINDTKIDPISQIVTESGAAVTLLTSADFDSVKAERRLCALWSVASLDVLGSYSRAAVSAIGALVGYLDLTQKGKLPLLRPPVQEFLHGSVQIDAATRRNLELTQAISGGKDGSLLAAIDRTVTAGGARLLDRRLSAPSRDLGVIQSRLDAVSWAVENGAERARLRGELRHVPDIERALSRLALDRGGPRDLTAIRAGLKCAAQLAPWLTEAPDGFLAVAAALSGHDPIIDLLDRALVAEPALLVRDGGFVASAFDHELDDTRALRDEGRGIVARMQSEFSVETGIQSLKIKHNNVLGYFIETTAIHGERMLSPPLSSRFIHRQTTAGQVRFTTIELSALETRILNAGGRALEIERKHFENLRQAVLAVSGKIGELARALAEIDLTCSLADLAQSEDWCRPKVDAGRAFVVTGGRHPVVERAMKRHGLGVFVANDCELTRDATPAIWLLTGPNMAGKSTFLRQNALIALMAQMGSFVPARTAHIGLVSQIFSRVGAADDLARGRSTFMVEMVETAAILNHADDRALVILDEIGRGTATYDGLSIAWAVMEHLHEVNRCRALFATHYHEMTALTARLSGAENATVAVREWEGEVIFLHEVRKGAADRSYGVQVARLAGLPASVVERARAVLETLEKSERDKSAGQRAMIDDLPLFRLAPQAIEQSAKVSALAARMKTVRPDELSPLEALRLVYELAELSASETPGSG